MALSRSTFVVWSLPIIIFVCGEIATIWTASSVEHDIEMEAQRDFDTQLRRLESTMTRRLRSYEDILFGVVGLFESHNEVSPESFRKYGYSLNTRKRYPALTTINYAQIVPSEQWARFSELHAAVLAKAPYPIPPPEEGVDYQIITCVYPDSASGLGLELFANANRRAPDALSKKVRLSRGDYVKNTVFTSGLPITVPDMPDKVLAARLGHYHYVNGKEMLVGTAGIGFNINSFFEEAIPSELNPNLVVVAATVKGVRGNAYDPPVLVYSSRPIKVDAGQNSRHSLFTGKFDVVFGQTVIRVTATSDKFAFIAARDKVLPFVALVGGTLFFMALGVLSRNVLQKNVRLNGLVKDRTRELQVELQRTRSLEQEVAHIAEEERRRIGRELHDDLGQHLVGLGLSAQILANQLKTQHESLAGRADAVERAASMAGAKIRNLAHGLLPVAPEPDGLRCALESLAQEVSATSGIFCMFDYDDPVTMSDEDTAAHLYRIAQESVTNALKHACADRIVIRLDYRGSGVLLQISDNGKGFNAGSNKQAPDRKRGSGMRLMAYRASIINYRLNVISRPGEGTIIEAVEC